VPIYLLIPLVVLALAVVLMALLVFLGKFRGGRYMQKLVMALAKIGFMRRFFTWSQKRLMEKQNPELASVMRKLERLGPSPDPRQTQQVISRFTRAEKRAYDEYLAMARDQGALPEAPNRQARRQQQRMQGAAKPSGSGAGAAKPAAGGTAPKKAGKRRR
jgi:hypothetical protein